MKNISERKKYYDRIIRYLKQIIPRFDDFALEPFMMNNDYIQLNWKEKESDYIFGPHQLSDGSLRYIALASLLLQPPDTSPTFIIIDEPELGLHPSAISSFAGMVKSVSQHKPIILATQSTGILRAGLIFWRIVCPLNNHKKMFRKKIFMDFATINSQNKIGLYFY